MQHLKKGYYVQPTIITDVNTSMEIWKEEVFGPVLCVKTFKTEEQAIELANDTKWELPIQTDVNHVFLSFHFYLFS